jgi:phosphoglycolate phosphatase-like HAD superfamily hydrolase
MHVLALDFDGVLCDSSREVFVVAVDAFAAHVPDSNLLPPLRVLRNRALAGEEGFRDDTLYRRFADLLPLGNRAEDFGVALTALERDLSIGEQSEYDALHEGLGAPWRDAFHRHFYEARDALRTANPGAWIGLHLPYPGLAEILWRHRDRTHLAMATAKDGRSVRLLLETLGLDGVFEPKLVLDKETGAHKTRHLEVLAERTAVPFTAITFVDDKVNHLQKTAVLGVRPVLAGWGFNTPREHRLARRLGYEIASLADAEHILFKGETA